MSEPDAGSDVVLRLGAVAADLVDEPARPIAHISGKVNKCGRWLGNCDGGGRPRPYCASDRRALSISCWRRMKR